MPTLKVRLINAKTLIAADLDGNSDPYCILKLGSTSHKSRTEPKTLNPTWNQTFQFSVSNPETDHLHLECYDHDAVGSDDSLGDAKIPLKDLVMGQEKIMWVKLEGGEMGENVVGMPSGEVMSRITGFLKKKTSNSSPNSSKKRISCK